MEPQLSELEKLPLDLLRLIGLELNFRKVEQYCILSKKFNRVCKEDFWKRKMEKDFKEDDISPIVYDNNYMNYLNTRQRWINNSNEDYRQEYIDNSMVLARYLNRFHKNEFKLFFTDTPKTDEANIKRQLKHRDLKPFNLILFMTEDKWYMTIIWALVFVLKTDDWEIVYQFDKELKMPVGFNYLFTHYGMSEESLQWLYFKDTGFKFKFLNS